MHKKGVIDYHASKLRLAHLKYAANQKLITPKEYRALRDGITIQDSQSFANYKPCTLVDFGKALVCNSRNKLKITQPLEMDKKILNQDSHNGKTGIPKKSEFTRKIKSNSTTCKNVNYGCTDQRTTSKDPVKIFVRQTNKKYENQPINEKSLVSQKKTVGEVFSQLLKNYKRAKLRQIKLKISHE